MKRIVISLVVVIGLLGAMRAARACGSGGNYDGLGLVYAGVLVGGAVDVAFTGYDLIQAAQGKPAGKGMAVAEILLVGPQAAVLTSIALSDHNSGALPVAIWTDLLVVHGVITLVVPEERVPPVGLTIGRRGKAQVTIAPTLVAGAKQLQPGLGAVGYF